MTKQIIFIFALLCTLQAQASVQPVQKDTVRHTIHYEVAELLQPMQPVYLNGVLLPASRTGNWFVIRGEKRCVSKFGRSENI